LGFKVWRFDLIWVFAIRDLGFAFSGLGFEVQRFKIWGWGFDLGFAHHCDLGRTYE